MLWHDGAQLDRESGLEARRMLRWQMVSAQYTSGDSGENSSFRETEKPLEDRAISRRPTH